MKRTLLLLSCCFVVTYSTDAQDQPPTYVFAISADLAGFLYQHPYDSLDVASLPAPIDSFRTTSEESERTPGHYLYVRPYLEELEIELRSYYAYRLETRNNDRDLALELADADGQMRMDADIRLGKRRIPFDEKTQTYRRKHWLRDGMLSVHIDQDTLFYQLSGNTSSPLFSRRIRYWRQSKVGFWLTSPIRWVENSYHYVKRGIRWGNWRFYNHPLWFLKSDRGFRGYVAGSQPLYRPGDTLRLKAYLTNHRGKPWSRAVHLTVRSSDAVSYRSQTHIDSVLRTDTPGHFELQWPLADSLPLDKSYTVSFEHLKKEKFDALQHTFRLEDYELDEATFSLNLAQSTYHRGEKIALQTEGRDKNEKFIAGAEVRLTLMTEQVKTAYTKELAIADTLWSYREYLRDQEPTQILLPDSIFPPADLDLKLHANFLHPSGELHPQEATFTYRHDPDKLILKLEGDSIVAGMERNGLPQTGRALLTRYGPNWEELPLESDTIELPYREAISPYVEYYDLDWDSLSTDIDVWEDHQSGVLVSGTWKPDTISITYSNPHRLNISWLLQSRTREIRRGSFSDAAGTVRIPVHDQRQWLLRYEYFWGQTVTAENPIYRLDKQLQVDIEQPVKVNPGATVPIKVKVQDQYGKAAAGVQLAAAAVNAQFKDPKAAYQPPVIPYKASREPFTFENFSVETMDKEESVSTKAGVTAAWFNKLGLRDYPFYQMRYQNSGAWMQWDTLTQDTFYRQLAQVSPYLIDRGKAIPVYLVYINDELVHYFASEDHPPYSFVGRPGYNSITLRTCDRVYQLDSVMLEKGKKLELAIEINRFQKGTGAPGMSIKPIQKEFSSQELYLLQQKTLALVRRQQQGEQYFWDTPHNIHWFRQWSPQHDIALISPFQNSGQIHHVHRGKFETTFAFEPGFAYNIDPTRERLYQWPGNERFRSDLKYKFPKVHPAGQLIIRPEDIQREYPPVPSALYFSTFSQERISGKGRLKLLNIPQSTDSLAVLAIDLQSEIGAEWIIPTYRSLIGGLDGGNYRINLVRSDGKIIRKDFTITPNQTLVLNFTGAGFETDSLRQWPERLYKVSSSARPEPAKPQQQLPPPPIQINPYENIGTLIRGQVLDSSGEPLIGASILVKGTTVGTVTDFDGYYSIWVPNGSSDLEISYTGFTTQSVRAFQLGQQGIILQEDAMALEEVVVTGFAVSHRKQLRTDPVQMLEGKVAGVTIQVPGRREKVIIRGLGQPTDAQPLVIINGQISSLEALQLLPADGVTSIEQLIDPEKLALYGARAANGVYLVTLKSGLQIPTPDLEPLEPGGDLRDQFRDYAFWQPHLVTDRNGEAWFQATFPDNITAWNTYVLGMDRKQRAGVGLARTQSWKSLTARITVPRFLIAGDSVEVVGQAVNYATDTLPVTTYFRQGDQDLFRMDHQLGSSLTDRYTLSAPVEKDSVELIYGLESAEYQDGEKRYIPLFQPGSMETEGQFMVLHRDTTVELSFEKDLPVEVFVADNALELLIEDLTYLKNYPHACMEQTASRLIALKLEQQIRKQLDQDFDEEKLIGKLVKKLERAQLANGAWSWWPGGSASHWITLHVMEALQWAQASPELSGPMEKGIRFLVNTLPAMSRPDQLKTLDLLSGFGQQLDYNAYLKPIDSLELPLHDQLLITRIRQRADLPYQLDTLDHYRRQTLYGASYWGDPLPPFWIYRRYYHPIATTLIAYDILKAAGRDQEVQSTRQYFLETRGIGQPNYRRAWYNTFETARVLAAILPDLLKENAGFRANQIQINGVVPDSLPYRGQIPNGRSISLKKSGAGPVYFTAYQQYHNRRPEPKSDVFQLSSQLHQDERIVDNLKQGQALTLEVKVTNDKDAEYVMVEIPIPAGCSYADRHINWGLEDHREYRRKKVVIYCSALPAGEHTFRVALEARLNGKFTINPARAEQMYFPVFYGRNGMRKVSVVGSR